MDNVVNLENYRTAQDFNKYLQQRTDAQLLALVNGLGLNNEERKKLAINELLERIDPGFLTNKSLGRIEKQLIAR